MALEDFFNKVSQLAQTGAAKVKELADEGVAKGKELSEIGKLKMEISSEQESIRKTYQELGQLYFATFGENPDEMFAALCEKVAAAKAKITCNEERIEAIRNASGRKEDVAAGSETEPCECCGEEETPECECGCAEETPAEEVPAEEIHDEEEPKE